MSLDEPDIATTATENGMFDAADVLDAANSPDVSQADVLDGAVGVDATAPDGAEGSVEDACVPDAQAGPQIIVTGFLDVGMMSQSERFYSGHFTLCGHPINGNASTLYTQDTSSIPPVTTGLTILHTFEPAGPYMTPPATQPPGKYSITQVSLAYDATIDTYTWSFYGINYVIWPCTPSPTCTSVDDAMYRVVIDIAQ